MIRVVAELNAYGIVLRIIKQSKLRIIVIISTLAKVFARNVRVMQREQCLQLRALRPIIDKNGKLFSSKKSANIANVVRLVKSIIIEGLNVVGGFEAKKTTRTIRIIRAIKVIEIIKSTGSIGPIRATGVTRAVKMDLFVKIKL